MTKAELRARSVRTGEVRHRDGCEIIAWHEGSRRCELGTVSGKGALPADDPSAVKAGPAIRDHTTSTITPSLVGDAAVKYPHGPAAYLDEPHTAGRPCLERDQERRLFRRRTLDDIAADTHDVKHHCPVRNDQNVSRDWLLLVRHPSFACKRYSLVGRRSAAD